MLGLLLCYGGTSSVLSASLGLLAWHVFDLMGPTMAGSALAVSKESGVLTMCIASAIEILQ